MWNENSNFLREKNVHFQEVNDSLIILNPASGKSHELNESGVFLWKILEENKTYSELTSLLCDEYDVSNDDAQKDVTDFIKEMHAQNLLNIND